MTAETTAARLASIRARADAAIEPVLEAAMMGDTDGGIIDPESDIPIGEAFRLALPVVEDARTDVWFLLDQLAAAEAKIAQVREWADVHHGHTVKSLHALDEILSASPVSALDAVRADAWELARYDEAVERLLNSRYVDEPQVMAIFAYADGEMTKAEMEKVID